MEENDMESGISFVYDNSDLAITRNGKTIISADQLYSVVFDLLAVNCFLPEDWPPIRQRYSEDRKTFEIAIGAESESQIAREMIDDVKYINQARQGEYFLESVIDPARFLQILRNKFEFLGLKEGRDFTIIYSRRLGKISIALHEEN